MITITAHRPLKISDAVKLLESLKKNHGDVDVYFDCPNCQQSFAPTVCVAVAVHLAEKKP